MEQIEGDQWAEPTHGSFLLRRCHELRRKPVEDFTVEDFRIMIGQSIGLSTPVPLAMVIVEADPFAEGDFYPGDLLTALLSLDSGWWQGSDDLRCRFVAMLRTLPKAHPALTKGIERFLTS